MEEQLISFETAKLANEKGFDLKTKHAYCDIKEHVLYDYHHGDEEIVPEITNILGSTEYHDQDIVIKYFVPIQSLLQKWLREKHNIHIEISLENFNDAYIWRYQILEIGEDYSTNIFDGEFKSYEEALEAGLQEALKLI